MKTYCGTYQQVQKSGHLELHQCIKEKGHSGPHTDGRHTWN